MENVWELVEDYSRKLATVDYWSGNVKNSSILKPAYEAKEKLELVLGEMKPEVWSQIEDYAHKIQAVDYWSGNVKNSSLLKPAYDAQAALKETIDQLTPGVATHKKFKPV